LNLPVKKELPAGLTAQKVVDDYIFAITKTSNSKQLAKKIKGTKAISYTMTGEVQGFSLTMTRVQTQGKLYEAVEAMGQTFQKKVFDGKKGYQKADLEGEELESAKVDANYIPEMMYAKNYTLNIKRHRNL
jgi:zinc protease